MTQQKLKCIICGKPLTKPESIEIGMGAICARKFGIIQRKIAKNSSFSNPQSTYDYWITEIEGKKIAIVIDRIDEVNVPSISVTNNIENVAKELGVKEIIYKDTKNAWDYWSFETGFISLAKYNPKIKKYENSTDVETAIEVAKAKNLFNTTPTLF